MLRGSCEWSPAREPRGRADDPRRAGGAAGAVLWTSTVRTAATTGPLGPGDVRSGNCGGIVTLTSRRRACWGPLLNCNEREGVSSEVSGNDAAHGTPRPRVLPQHLALRHGAHALPAGAQGPGSRQPPRLDGMAAVLRAGHRPRLGVLRGAPQPRGDPTAPLLAPRGALRPVRRRGHRRALPRRPPQRRPRLAGTRPGPPPDSPGSSEIPVQIPVRRADIPPTR